MPKPEDFWEDAITIDDFEEDLLFAKNSEPTTFENKVLLIERGLIQRDNEL